MLMVCPANALPAATCIIHSIVLSYTDFFLLLSLFQDYTGLVSTGTRQTVFYSFSGRFTVSTFFPHYLAQVHSDGFSFPPTYVHVAIAVYIGFFPSYLTRQFSK